MALDGGPMTVLGTVASGCSPGPQGTAGTSVVVTNTCAGPLLVRLTGANWDRSPRDQLKGERAAVDATVDATAVNPPDKRGLILRITPDSGEPILVVPIERDHDLKLSISAEACPFALGVGEGSCDVVIEGPEEHTVGCR